MNEVDLKKLLIAAMILGLAGCASVGDLRGGVPILSGKTKKSAQSMSACVAEKWGKTFYQTTSSPLSDGYSIQILNNIAGADAVIDIRDVDGGSSYSLFERMQSLTSNKIGNAINDCK